MNKMTKRRGISPIIATILLIAIVVVLALIIFLWARGFVRERVQKNERDADIVCNEVKLEVDYNDDELDVINRGDIPLYRLEIKKNSKGSVDKQSEETRIPVGGTATINVGAGYDKIEVYPVILGEVKTSKKAYTCKNSFGAE